MQSLNRILAARTLLAATAVGAGVTAGCSSGGYQRDDYYDAYAYDTYYDRPAYYGRPGYYYDDPYHHHGHYRDHRDYHRDHGHDHRDHGRDHREHRGRVRVPHDADVVASGNRPLAYTAEQSGRVYVRDERTGKVIYRGRVDAGDEVKVGADARGRRVSVDGRTVRGDLSAKPRERDVFFRPDRGTAGGSERSARQAAARETRAARAEAKSEARPAARAESSRGGGGKGSGDQGD